jgi:hypothetical protein
MRAKPSGITSAVLSGTDRGFSATSHRREGVLPALTEPPLVGGDASMSLGRGRTRTIMSSHGSIGIKAVGLIRIWTWSSPNSRRLCRRD